MSNNWDPFVPLNRFYKLPNPSHVWSSLIIISPPHLYEGERSAGKENFNILYDACNIQVIDFDNGIRRMQKDFKFFLVQVY